MDLERDQVVGKCRETLQWFDAWALGLSEERLRVNFRRLAQIREHLNGTLREAEEMV